MISRDTHFPRRARLALRASMIAVGGVVLAAGAPAIAQTADTSTDPAQTTTEQPGDAAPAGDIIVTGFRGSIQSAITAKRNATQIIESISAEDVGKLPDVSITDALARLPGVTAQQNAGRATYLSIRGFGPDFTTATLNGRVVATIDDNRRFQYDQFPGDLFSRIDVIKTPSADLMNQGLAGTVNLMTIDPLTAKPTLAINLQGEVNGKSKLNPDGDDKGYKGSLIFTHRFANDTIGVSLGGSAISSPVQTQGYATWGYNNGVLGGAKWYSATNVLKRQAGFGHVVWKPSDRFETSIDGLYSHSTTRELWRGVEMPLSYGAGVTLASATYGADGWLDSATFNPTWPVQRNNYNTRDADTWAIGWNAKAALTDSVRFIVDASYSHAHRHDNAIETYTGTSYNRSGTSQVSTITLQKNGTYTLDTNLDYTDLSTMVFTDPQGWGYYSTPKPTDPHSGAVPQSGYINEPDFTDRVKTLRGAFEGDINAGVLKSWEVGAYYSDEKKTNAFTGFYLIPPGGANTLAIPSSIVIGTVSPHGLSGSKVIAYDVNSAVDLLDSFRNEQPSESTKQWWVRERILTGYAQLNFDGDVSGHRISGNLGAQFVHTVQDASGYAAINTDVVSPVYSKTKYDYVLPQATFNLEFTPSFILRMGAGRTLARARLSDENPSFTVSASAVPNNQNQFYQGEFTPLSGSGGNPVLRPYFSNYVDISLEKYFANNQGKIALAGYYKDITNFVQTSKSYITDLSAFAALIPANVQTPYTTMGWVSSSANTGRGYVQGFELSGAAPFSILSSALNGFGATGSIAYADSVIKFDNGSPVTLPGLSKWVGQAQVYFEKWGFSARASYNYRSDYLGEYQAYGAQPALKTTKGGSTLDAQIGYDFRSGVLDGLSLYVQARNLTNMPFVTYLNNDKRQIDIYEKYGPTYTAGLTYKF